MLDPLDLQYPGGKGLGGLHQWIIEHLPPHVYYAEPFAGKGGVFRNKRPALRSWLIDADERVVAWWQAHELRAAIATVGDGIRWTELAAEWGPPDLLVYLDPPYMLETRVKKRIYRRELSTADHARLLTAAVAIRGPVVISGYWSDLYAERLAEWRCERRWEQTRGGLRQECLWLSPAVETSPAVAMKYSDLGSNYRERERVARKLTRWKAMLRALPARERRALLLALLDDAGDDRC